MALQATTLASSIAALSVPGVSITGLDAIPEEVAGRLCPVMYPKPDGFMANLRVARDSFGPAPGAAKTVRYTLNYVYLHAPVGEGRGLHDVYAAMVGNVLAILDALIAADALSGALDVTPAALVNFGPQLDPAGSQWFFGTQLAFDVTELVN